MKTTTRFIVGILIGLAVGFGFGLYTAHVRNTGAQTHVAAVKQPTESPELFAARARLSEFQKIYTDENPTLKKLRERILVLEQQQRAK